MLLLSPLHHIILLRKAVLSNVLLHITFFVFPCPWVPDFQLQLSNLISALGFGNDIGTYYMRILSHRIQLWQLVTAKPGKATLIGICTLQSTVCYLGLVGWKQQHMTMLAKAVISVLILTPLSPIFKKLSNQIYHLVLTVIAQHPSEFKNMVFSCNRTTFYQNTSWCALSKLYDEHEKPKSTNQDPLIINDLSFALLAFFTRQNVLTAIENMVLVKTAQHSPEYHLKCSFNILQRAWGTNKH